MNNIINTLQARYLHTLLKESSPLIKEMEDYARENNIPILLPESAAVLEMLITLNKPRLALEVGTAIGYSSIRIAGKLADDAKLITLEKSPGSFEKSREYIMRSGQESKIEVVFGEAAGFIENCSSEFDFIFLDCDKKDYVPFLLPLIGLLKKGGVIVADNLLWYGYSAMSIDEVPQSYQSSAKHVKKFNELFFGQPALDAVMLPVGDGLGVAIKK